MCTSVSYSAVSSLNIHASSLSLRYHAWSQSRSSNSPPPAPVPVWSDYLKSIWRMSTAPIVHNLLLLIPYLSRNSFTRGSYHGESIAEVCGKYDSMISLGAELAGDMWELLNDCYVLIALRKTRLWLTPTDRSQRYMRKKPITISSIANLLPLKSRSNARSSMRGTWAPSNVT